jgi:hypothetical protein
MMTQEQKEAFKAVQKINEELYLKYFKNNDIDNVPILNIAFANQMIFIGLSIPSSRIDLDIPEIHLYNSVNNDRIFYEKSNKYETFYKFIKRKFIEIKEEIYKVKL